MDAEAVVGHRARRRRSVAEKLQIVQLTREAGASVAEVARAHGINANLLFKWRREFERSQPAKTDTLATALLPVTISDGDEAKSETSDATADVRTPSGGAIHIELPGRVIISVESGVDRALLRCVLASLRKRSSYPQGPGSGLQPA
jgi:transposase